MIRVFADNLVGLGFFVVCFLHENNPNPRKIIRCGGKKKGGPIATFNLFFLGLGWPWVGAFVGFIIIFTCSSFFSCFLEKLGARRAGDVVAMIVFRVDDIRIAEWVGEFVGFVIVFACFRTQQNLVHCKHPNIVSCCGSYQIYGIYVLSVGCWVWSAFERCVACIVCVCLCFMCLYVLYARVACLYALHVESCPSSRCAGIIDRRAICSEGSPTRR